MPDIHPIAMPETHERFFDYFKKQKFDQKLKILDLGAGHGAFTKRLFELGYDMSACDMSPEIFQFDKIACTKADITRNLPYPDNTFDQVIAIEVSEHIIDHEVFFSEVSRILKPEGQLQLSTPNVLSLKSRIRFLFRGFFYSFGPLDHHNYNGMQHVASLTLDQYNYVAIKNGFGKADVEIDKKQNSSRWLRIFLSAFMWLNTALKNAPTLHNKKALLLGRILFLRFKNAKIRET